MLKKRHIVLLILAASLIIASCLRRSFDNPPDTTGYDPKLQVTHTIAQLKALNGAYVPSTGGDTTLITEDITICGIVTADDRSGNFYKQIVIQDSTAALFVDLDAYSLYNDYPVGRKLYIKCKGLYLGYNGGVMELGSSLNSQLQVNGLIGAAIADHVIKGNVSNPVSDTVISLAQLKALANTADGRSLIGRLITIPDVQFADTAATYSDPTATTNRTIVNCQGNTSGIAVRNSNYASFHAQQLAGGRGTITGIYTVYQTTFVTPQLLIRDTADVKMYDTRCDTAIVPSVTTLQALRSMYPGSGTFTIPSLHVSGTVISDISKGNVSAGNFILQDGSKRGIILYLSSGSYKLGDSLVIDATNAKLQLYSGSMELTGLTSSKITRVATGRAVTPVQLTIAQLNASFPQYESVLIKIVNATVTGGTTYSGNKTLSDGTGTISLYTAPAASFSGSTVPTTAKSFTGIGTIYTPNEIKLRDPLIDVY